MTVVMPIPLDCARYGRGYVEPVTAEMLTSLQAKGVTPDQVVASIVQGQLAQRLLCPDCARSSVN